MEVATTPKKSCNNPPKSCRPSRSAIVLSNWKVTVTFLGVVATFLDVVATSIWGLLQLPFGGCCNFHLGVVTTSIWGLLQLRPSPFDPGVPSPLDPPTDFPERFPGPSRPAARKSFQSRLQVNFKVATTSKKSCNNLGKSYSNLAVTPSGRYPQWIDPFYRCVLAGAPLQG